MKIINLKAKFIKLSITLLFACVSFSTCGFTQLKVAADGQVGIETTGSMPWYDLHVNGSFGVRRNSNVLRIEALPFEMVASGRDKIDFWYYNFRHNKLYAEKYYKFPDSTIKSNNTPPFLVDSMKTLHNTNEQQWSSIDSLRNRVTELEIQMQQLGSYSPEQNSESETIDFSHFSSLKNNSELLQNAPNPFTKSTVIKYIVPNSFTSASVMLFDMSGKLIHTYPISNDSSEQT